MRFLSLFLAGFLFSGFPLQAASHTLYATVSLTRDYLVGGKFQDSGLFAYRDGLWRHIGFKHPRIEALAAHPENPNILYLAAGNGVLRTTDAGHSWRIVTDWRQNLTKDVAVDPHAPDDLYLATPEGLWVSRDRGDHWEWLNSGIKRPYIMTVEVDSTRQGRVFGGYEQGIFLSENGARSWQPVAAKGIHITAIRQSAANPGLWVAATQEGGLHLSRDGGRNWAKNPDIPVSALLYCLALHPLDADRIATGGYETGLYLSSNGGKDWIQIREPFPATTINEVLFHPDQKETLIVNVPREGVYRSDDFGQSWSSMNLPSSVVWDMAFLPNP